MKYYIYVLQSKRDRGWYIGLSKNVELRLKYHNSGRVISTRKRKPFRLLYKESFNNSSDAQKAEKYYKSGAGRKKLKEILKQDL